MAWNPTPQVAIARDAAARIGEEIKAPVDRIVVLYTTEDGRFGYASYGKNKSLCGEARRLGDHLYAAASEWFAENI